MPLAPQLYQEENWRGDLLGSNIFGTSAIVASFPVAVAPSFTHLQGASGTGTSPATITLASNPIQGNVVCVGVALGNAAIGTLTVTDGNSNSYTVLATVASNTATSAQLAYLLVPAGASKTLTLSWTSGGLGDCFADEFTVVGGTASFDIESAAGTGTSATPNTPSITPNHSNSLLYGIMATGSDTTAPLAGNTLSGWTGCTNNGANQGMGAEYQVTGSGATAIAFTTAASAAYAALSMAFFITASGGGGVGPSGKTSVTQPDIGGFSAVSGTMLGAAPLASVILAPPFISMFGIPNVTGVLLGAGALNDVILGVGSVTGAITGVGALSVTAPDILGAAAISAALTGVGALSVSAPDILGIATVNGTLTGLGALNAIINGTGVVTGTVLGAGSLNGVINGTSTVTATLLGAGALNAAINGTSVVVANAILIGFIACNIVGASTVIGTLSVPASGPTAIITGSAQLVATLTGIIAANGAIQGTGVLAGLMGDFLVLDVILACNNAIAASMTLVLENLAIAPAPRSATLFTNPQQVLQANVATFTMLNTSTPALSVAAQRTLFAVTVFSSLHAVQSLIQIASVLPPSGVPTPTWIATLQTLWQSYNVLSVIYGDTQSPTHLD